MSYRDRLRVAWEKACIESRPRNEDEATDQVGAAMTALIACILISRRIFAGKPFANSMMEDLQDAIANTIAGYFEAHERRN